MRTTHKGTTLLDRLHYSAGICSACPMANVGAVTYPVAHGVQHCLGYLHCEVGPVGNAGVADYAVFECDGCGFMQRVNNVKVVPSEPELRQRVDEMRHGKREVHNGQMCRRLTLTDHDGAGLQLVDLLFVDDRFEIDVQTTEETGTTITLREKRKR